MSNCNCNHGAGVLPGPCVSPNCGKPNENLRIKTVVLPTSVGTDAEGQPYAPALGAFTNTIVTYQATGSIYFYDSKGIWTKFENGTLDAELANEIATRQEDVANLQTNINQLANKEAADVEALQTNINTEVNNRTAQYETLHQGIIDENSRAYNAEQSLQQTIENLDASITTSLEGKQAILVGEGEGQNIKTVNGENILGEGNIEITAPAPVSPAASVLYTSTEGATSITLSESATGFEKIVLLGYYEVAEGENVDVNGEWYSASNSLTFALSHNEMVTGDTPSFIAMQDKYIVSDTGEELSLSVANKAVVENGGTLAVTSETTLPNFIITTVLGINKTT